MTEDSDLLGPFDDTVLDRVAGRHDLTTDRLRDLLARHQRLARDRPGVEDLVYEWRSQFHDQPLLERRPGVYFLRLRPHVWDEFADALDLSEADLFALLDAHEEQTRAETGATFDDEEHAMVLSRDRA